MTITFWGAARQVTGSMHLLEIKHKGNPYRILIDCGLDYEHRELKSGSIFPFEASSIDLVILTHAHIDHSGNLPTLVKEGFSGPIVSTQPTADLSYLLVSDSVNIFMSKQMAAAQRKGKKSGKLKQPLYLQRDVEQCMKQFFELAPNLPFVVNDTLTLELIPVGHLLGAVGVLLTVQEETEKKIFFSGDVGRSHYPILQPPQAVPETDYLVCESTYGGRLHSKGGSVEDMLVKHIRETCLDQPGRLIIPAFSVGRTQALVFSLNKIFSSGKLPPVRVFVDSPLGIHSTEIYRKHRAQLNPEAMNFYESKGDNFDFENLVYVEDVQESKRINSYREPCIIVSSAGMLEGGRIQEHLYNNIQNFYCTILFIGYCAKGTLGRKLLDGELNVKINNRDMDVYARIASTDLLSAHADNDELLGFINAAPERLKKTFFVHGELSAMQSLADQLSSRPVEAFLPEKGQTFEF